MAGTARSVFTRLLPWAALALMTVMFFVQVKARQKAEADATKARDDLQAVREDRVIGHRPTLSPLLPSRIEAGAIGSEIAVLRKQLEAAHEELAAAKIAHQALLDRAERTEALRVTESARASALDAQLAADAAAAEKRVAELAAELKEAKAQLERRQSPVARWITLAQSGGPDALTVLRAETPKATAEDLQELGAHWREARPVRDASAVAPVLEHMPVTAASAGLAADLLLAYESDRAAARILPRLGQHILHPEAVARVLAAGSNERREDVLSHAVAGAGKWDADGRARVAAALAGQFGSDDAWTLEIAIRAFPRLGLEGHAGKLLPFLTHDVAEVRIAAVYALLKTSDRKSALRTLQPTVVALLDEQAFDVRMAGLFLAQELAGEKRSLAFGSSDQAVSKELERLKTKLATLAKE